MKRIQIGFAAVIAVLAMSFTIAEHSGAFNAKSAKLTTDCFKAGGTNGLKIRHSCTSATITISVTDPCSVTMQGDRVWSLDANNVIAAGNITTECPGGNTFCCFQVTEDTGPCLSPNVQPTFGIGAGAKPYKVNAVYCKLP
jgi:hypothetical protein